MGPHVITRSIDHEESWLVDMGGKMSERQSPEERWPEEAYGMADGV
jgi:hypothetical protein